MQLSLEQIRGLAELERKMDSGDQPYVLNRGDRWAFSGDVLKHLGIESGRNVSDHLLIEIRKTNLLNLRMKMEREETR